MRNGIDEPKLTAYALGEMDEGERAAVEAAIAGDPEALAHVEEVRRAAGLLEDGLAREPELALTGAQHAAIERRLAGAGARHATPTHAPLLRRNWGLWASVAASTLIVCTVMAAVLPRVLPVGSGNGAGGRGSGGGPDASRGPIIFAPPAGEAPVADDAEPAGGGVTVIEVEKAPQRVEVRRLGTRGYAPTAAEKRHLEQTAQYERTQGPIPDDRTGYDLHARRGTRVAWFGIVREIGKVERGEDGRPDAYELLLEHKYFDGLTDLDILALSFNGAGDFKAKVWTREKELPIKPLMLVRVYGNVTPGDVLPGGRALTQPAAPPIVEVEYARAFPWKTFTFLDAYGKDSTNPRWRRLCQVPLDRIYSSTPTDEYYRQRLGD